MAKVNRGVMRKKNEINRKDLAKSVLRNKGEREKQTNKTKIDLAI